MQKLFIALTLTASTLTYGQTLVTRDVASIKPSYRVGHARELLGKRYKRSVVYNFHENSNLDKNLHALVQARLPKAFKNQSAAISEAIIHESKEHSLDPYFLMAVISGESSFNPLARGPVGEMGLMQIRPETAQWIAQKLGIPWKNAKALNNPVYNIKLGTAYLSYLRQKFEGHGQLYIAAYNMGARSVRNALGRNVWPKDYPIHVMKRYLAFYKEMGLAKL
jgi:soluble lytic murein transglycosylase